MSVFPRLDSTSIIPFQGPVIVIYDKTITCGFGNDLGFSIAVNVPGGKIRINSSRVVGIIEREVVFSGIALKAQIFPPDVRSSINVTSTRSGTSCWSIFPSPFVSLKGMIAGGAFINQTPLGNLHRHFTPAESGSLARPGSPCRKPGSYSSHPVRELRHRSQ